MREMKRIATLWLVLVALATPAAAQTHRPMDYADIFRLATLQGADLSPDGAWVVYEVSKLQFPAWQRRTDLYVVSADGRTTRQLTYTEGEDESGARWHPRGGVIGFTSSRDNKKRQLFLIRPDGGEARRATDVEDGIGAWAWSRDGATIAYIAGPEGKRQVWRLPGDGAGKAEPLTKHATSIEAFAWSEDGRTIYFTAPDEPDSTRRRRLKEKFDVRVMNEPAAAIQLWAFDVAGKAERRLTEGDYRVAGLELSRDGRWAAFRGRPTDRYADDRATELYLVNLTTGAVERLTNNYVGEQAPSFSPDSRLIAFTADRDFRFGNLSRVYVRPVERGGGANGGSWAAATPGTSPCPSGAPTAGRSASTATKG
jgi:Tol biopolymer transport system component